MATNPLFSAEINSIDDGRIDVEATMNGIVVDVSASEPEVYHVLLDEAGVRILIDALTRAMIGFVKARSPDARRGDWRIGLSCKPRLRTHADYYEPPGVIVGTYASGEGGITDPNGVLRIQRGDKFFLAPAGDWITA